MKQLSNIITMSSREVAELTGKRHSDVLEAIRNMEVAWEKVTQRKFPLVEYIDIKGEHRPMYQLTRTECLYVATKFSDEARAKLVVRWEELEQKQQYAIPQSYSAALMLAAQQAEQIELQSKTILRQAPKVLFADAVATSDRSVLVAELAKVLNQNGVDIGQNRLFGWLRRHGYLCSRGESYNQPTQKSMDLGLFELKKTSIAKPDGSVLVSCTTKVTGKGQIYFTSKFLESNSIEY